MDMIALSTLPLDAALTALLPNYPAGLSEFALIRQLQQQGDLPDLPLHEPLVLFQIHFILFHTLYTLRNQLRAERQGDLAIHTLNIRLLPYQPAEASLTAADPLSLYYLDPRHLEETRQSDVLQLLDQFWQQLRQRLPPPNTAEYRAALACLAVSPTAPLAEIKSHYRRLVMQHHPDRGGDLGQIQALNRAMAIITRYHSNR